MCRFSFRLKKTCEVLIGSNERAGVVVCVGRDVISEGFQLNGLTYISAFTGEV